MKYNSAIGRLRQVADELTDHTSTWGNSVIVEAHVFGDLLAGPDTIEVIWLALVVDLPVEDVTWLARPAQAEATASILRFDKYPLRWRWRPTVWPVWNHTISRPVRFWSKEHGPDQTALEILANRRLGELAVLEPTDQAAYRAQLQTELEASRRHLGRVVNSYHDRNWRRDHNGFGVYPEDHLWWATQGFLELDDALQEIDQPIPPP
ncbi:MAG: hypothetical protein OEM81_12605 [Acidimicrobiia bacterium]|nr:hypothetical protein [Acidimicrobiia bacterium]MDH3398653.1 hypothetical protein [Acidimicrobiia bacterium]